MLLPSYSAAAVRNSAPILGVLRREFAGCHEVLEIGSGTARHAVDFATALPELHWQTSDLAENHALIRAQLRDAGLANVLPPLALDMEAPPAAGMSYDAVYSCNTLHIMSIQAVSKLLPFVAASLRPGGVFCYYGPFRRHGAFNTPSNERFDLTLQEANPAMGLRELDDVTAMAAAAGLRRERIYAMPANNLLLVWLRERRDRAADLSASSD